MTKKRYSNFRELKQVFTNGDFNKPNDCGKEGVDHINISLDSELQVGKFLDPGYNYRFSYPMVGSFVSVFALIYWLRDDEKNDLIRTLKRKDFRLLPKAVRFKRLENHKAILLLASMEKLLARPQFIQAIYDLPDDVKVMSYTKHKSSGLRITTNYASIVVPVMRELVAAIKNKRDINYTRFITDGGTLEYGFLENIMKFDIEAKEEVKAKDVKEEVVEEPKQVEPRGAGIAYMDEAAFTTTQDPVKEECDEELDEDVPMEPISINTEDGNLLVDSQQ